jgi:4'-phosphopantetheinyl transferase
MKPGVRLTLARFNPPECGAWLTSAVKVLSEPERERVVAMPDTAARAQHAVGRALLRLLGAQASAGDPRRLLVTVSAAGKPLLPDFPDLHVSIAHTTGLVVVAACRSATVGVDVEPARSPAGQERRLARRLFDRSEVETLLNVPDADVPDWFSSMWTIKEAVGKALGDGMIPALSGAVVRCEAGRFTLGSVWRGPPADSWTLHQLAAPAGTEKIAVALPAPNVPLEPVTSMTLDSFADACSATTLSSR